MTSLQAVARAANVSISTASRVISNSDYPVREETRQRVLKAVEELNYSPSSLARALVTQRTNIVGIIVHDVLDPYFAEIVRGVEDLAREHGYLTIVCNSDRQIASETNYLRMLRDYQVDGIIFAAGGLSGEGAEELQHTVLQIQESGARTRMIALAPQHLDLPLVTIDNLRASREMTEYLINMGHRRIGLVTGPKQLITSDLRLDGYLQAIENSDLLSAPELIAQGNFDLESGRQAAAKLMDLSDPPTAIFATNDEMAIGCLVTLRERNIDVPREVSVVGFDDLKLLQGVYPPLTTIHVPLYDLGAIAMQQLLRSFDGDPIESALTLEHHIAVRQSASTPTRKLVPDVKPAVSGSDAP